MNCIEDQYPSSELDPNSPDYVHKKELTPIISGGDKPKYRKAKDGSYVHNCHLAFRANDKAKYLFYQPPGEGYISAFLNGYAIIPMEEYCRLKAEPYDSVKIKQADLELHGK